MSTTAAAAKRDLARLALLPETQKSFAHARAVVRRHGATIRAVFADPGFPTFRGRTAREAWEFFRALEAAWKPFAQRIKRQLGLSLYALGVAPEVTASLYAERRDRGLTLASTDKKHPAAATAFFAPLIALPDMARAAALLAAPHDVREAQPAGFCNPRPWRGAPEKELIAYLLDRRSAGAATPRERAELERFALAALSRAPRRRVKDGGDPTRFWTELDAALARAHVFLSIADHGTRLELEPSLRMVNARAPDEGEAIVESAAVARAIYAALDARGAPWRTVLAAARRDRALLGGRLRKLLDAIRYYETRLRTRPQPWARSVRVPRPR